MSQFALYHYELSAFTNKEPLLFPINDSSRQYKTLENLFESYLPGRGGSLNVLEPKVSGKGENKITEYEPHESEVLQNQNHIIAFKVQRNGTKQIETIDWQKRNEPNHPSVRVLIDNREDRQIIAIENKSSFKSDKAFELLSKHFNVKLKAHYVRFECYPLVKRAQFWESVNEIKNRFGDFIKRVQFNFVGDDRKSPSKFADQLASFLSVINSAHGGIFMDFNDEDRLNNARDDIQHMADLCYQNRNYNLSVKFRDFGTFSYGQDIKAQWGLEDDKIDAFIQLDRSNLEKSAYKDIADWFDKIKELFSEYIANGIREIYNFDNCILKTQRQSEIRSLLHRYVDSCDKPKDVLRPLAAAVMAGCILRPSLELFNFEFKKSIPKSSYNRLVKDNSLGINPYEGDAAYAAMLAEFKQI